MKKLNSKGLDLQGRRVLMRVETRPEKGISTEQSELLLRQRGFNFLLWVYGGLLACTVAIFFLQGFGVWGFRLDDTLLQWLGGATVGEIAGLLALVYGFLFKRGAYFIVRELIRLYESGKITEDVFKELLISDGLGQLISGLKKGRTMPKAHFHRRF